MKSASNAARQEGVQEHDRMFGLDVCRSLAILSVVLGHLLMHSSPNAVVASLGFVAIFGVDLFFCLSGFLIGRILLADSSRWPIEREQGVTRFWYRRWMRTLPLYFLFLFVELQVYWDGASSIAAQASYLLFAQNLAWPMANFYLVTWSLAVEEWFYFLFPLMILLWIGLGKTPRTAVAITIAVFLLIPPALRFFLFGEQGNFDSLDPGIRHVVIFRLDSIGFGVLIAYIDQWHKTLFRKIAELRWVFVALAIALMAYIKYQYFGLTQTSYTVSLYFSVSALVFAALIPFFAGLSSTRFKLLNRFVKYTSLISYSLYLGHIVAFNIGVAIFRKLGVFDGIYPNPWLTYPFFLALVYLFASFTYFSIERPFLAMRDRQSKTKVKQSAMSAR